MTQFKLKENQAALIFDVSPEGEVSVEAMLNNANTDEAGDLAAAICSVIGRKLTEDEEFQADILNSLDDETE